MTIGTVTFSPNGDIAITSPFVSTSADGMNFIAELGDLTLESNVDITFSPTAGPYEPFSLVSCVLMQLR